MKSSLSADLRFDDVMVNLLQMGWLLIFIIFLISLVSTSTTAVLSAPLLHFGNYHLAVMLSFDALARLMSGLVIILTLIIYQYAKVYLDSDTTRLRFLIQLSLVSLSVLILVTSANLLTGFIGWQLIGLNLYIILNHYHYDLQANRAAKKKFIINRIGDLSFLVAVVIAYCKFGSSSYQVLYSQESTIWIVALTFIAVMTKSAQFPFHIWLPDTMETPTPVSALMHAGVINAGGFLLTRLAPIYAHHSAVMYAVFVCGLLTVLFGAVLMRQQPDTKKKLAYSTMSQMGYMVMQCGLGVFTAAIFHLIAHGFYKATLFLRAGETVNASPAKGANEHRNLKSAVIKLVALLLSALLGIITFGLWGRAPIPLLMQTFIVITLSSLLYHQWQLHKSWLGWLVSTFIVTLLLNTYMGMLSLVTIPLGFYDQSQTISQPVQIAFSAALVIAQLIGWLCLSNSSRSRFWQKITYHKFGIEACARRYLLFPLRQIGELINRYFWSLCGCSALLLAWLIASNIFQWWDYPVSHTSLFIAGIIIAATGANRAQTLKATFLWLLILEIGFCCLALFDPSRAVQDVGILHLVNITLVLLMLRRLKLKRTQASNAPKLSTQNKLSWHLFYLSSALLLLLGIPGTASFITEFYILASLYQQSWLLTLSYTSGIMLLAIAVMHTLQLYVFNDRHPELKSLPITTVEHLVYWSIIIFNVFNGVVPHVLLDAICQLRKIL